MLRIGIACLVIALGRTAPAEAQSTDDDSMNAMIISTTPSGGPSTEERYQRDLEDANTRILKIRNTLIGTSSATALGLVLTGIGASQCQILETPGQDDEVLCNTAGNVLVPLGGTFVVFGAIGMITSGIMLGVAKKRRRELERDFRRNPYGRRLEWHPSGALRF